MTRTHVSPRHDHDDITDLADEALTATPLEPDVEYWCQHCHQTFFGRDARPDFFGGCQGCADPACTACGLGIDVFRADDPYVTGDGGYDCDDGDRYDLRDEILGIETMTDVDDIARFAGLRLSALSVLFEERLVDPDARQNRAPSTIECAMFLCRWPEVTLHGYAVHPLREGDPGSVRIEGLECDPSTVDEARREPLREAFAAFTQGADERVDVDGELYAWWD